MPLRVLIIVVLIALGAIWLVTSRLHNGSSGNASCLADVDKLARSYGEHRPQGGSHDQIENGIARAREYCDQGKYADAQRLVNTSGMICRLNNGCGAR